MKDQSSNYFIYDTVIRLLIIIGVIAWCIIIIYPFAGILLWSIILAIAFFPLHTKLTKKLGGKPKLASFIIVFSILAIFILPTAVIIDHLIGEVRLLKISFNNGTLAIPPPSENVKDWPLIGEKLYDYWHSAFVNIEQVVLDNKEWLINIGKKILDGIISATSGLIQIIISFLIAGVVLAVKGSNQPLLKFFRKVGGNLGDEISELVTRTIESVVKGVIGEGLIIALLNGIVFILAGVPYAGIWALLVFVFAVIQLPIYFISVPIMIYLFTVMDTMSAILWSIALLLVSFSDNFLTPLMLGKNAPVPTPVIFIGVIGGCVSFGFIGLFTGAIVMSVGYTLLVKWINPKTEETSKLETSK